MFLGAPIDLPYEEAAFQFSAGDVLLLMTDGLAEVLNAEDETLDYPRVLECFEKAATLPPRAIIESLLAQSDAWRGNYPQHDDITLMVIRRKPSPGTCGPHV